MSNKSKQTRRYIGRGMLATMAVTSVVPMVTPTISFAAQKKSDSNVETKQESGLKIAVISDTHIFPEEFVGNEGPNYQGYVNGDRKMLKESERILASSIDRVLKSDAEIVLIPGDLTKDSEVEGHEIVAAGIEKLEKAGKQVFVTNGNHDINAPDAEKFVPVKGEVGDEDREDKVEKLDGIKADAFEELYAKYGFNDENTIANDPNSTSYVAKLKPGYRLIAMDTGIYGENKEDQSTSGTLNGRLEWILKQIKEAKEAGDTVIGMCHHGIVEHFDGQGTVFAPYLVEDYENVSTKLADAGMEYVFTGHFHAQDVAIKKTESGNVINDIMTGSSVSYPSPIRFVEIDKDIEKIHIETERIESIDGVENFKEYSEEAMRAGIPGMVSSLLSGIVIDMIDSNFPSSSEEQMKQIKSIVEEYVNGVIDENRELIDEELEKNPEALADGDNTPDNDVVIIPGGEGKPPILKKSKLISYVNAVCEELKTVELKPGYKLMDAIETGLMEVYKGDEEYSDAMKTLKEELESTPMVQDALVKVLNKHKMKLGVVLGVVINEKMLNGLFDTKVSEEQTLGQLIGGAFAGLLNGVLTDDTPDNNAAYIEDRLVDFKLSKLIGESKSIEKGNYTDSSFRKFQNALTESIITIKDKDSSQEQINESKSKLKAAKNQLINVETDETGTVDAILTPQTKDGLQELVNDLKGLNPKIVEMRESGDNLIYKIKIDKKEVLKGSLKGAKNGSTFTYIEIKVAKTIVDELGGDIGIGNGNNAGGGSGGGGSTGGTSTIETRKLFGKDRYKTAVEISKEGWSKSDTVFIVSGEDRSLVDGLTTTPLASSKNAPILLTKNNSLEKDTADEIKRLNPSQVVVIGGEASVSKSVIDDIKNINSNLKVERIGGLNRYETSLNIAKELDKSNDVSKIFIGAGDGEADSLSISPVAGREKSPILLTKKDGLDKQTTDFIKNEEVKDAHIIGGEEKISSTVIDDVNKITSNDISKNRISGLNRQETNAKVIEKFYTNSKINGVAVAKSDQLIDALSVGPLAAKKDIPVVLATTSLDKSQENVISEKKATKLFEIGGGIASSVMDSIKNLIK